MRCLQSPCLSFIVPVYFLFHTLGVMYRVQNSSRSSHSWSLIKTRFKLLSLAISFTMGHWWSQWWALFWSHTVGKDSTGLAYCMGENLPSDLKGDFLLPPSYYIWRIYGQNIRETSTFFLYLENLPSDLRGNFHLSHIYCSGSIYYLISGKPPSFIIVELHL